MFLVFGFFFFFFFFLKKKKMLSQGLDHKSGQS